MRLRGTLARHVLDNTDFPRKSTLRNAQTRNCSCAPPRAPEALQASLHQEELPVVDKACEEVMLCRPCAPGPKDAVPVGLLLNMNQLQNMSVQARDRMLRDRGVPQPRMEEDCPICFEPLSGQVVVFSRCGHAFHRLCARQAGRRERQRQLTARANCSGFGDPLFEAQLGYSCCADRVRITDDEAGELQLQAWPQLLQGYQGQIASPLASLDMDEDRFRAYLQQRTAALGVNELGVAWTMPDGWTTTLLQLAMQRNLVGHVRVLIGIGAPLQGSLLGALRQAVRPGGSLELVDLLLAQGLNAVLRQVPANYDPTTMTEVNYHSPFAIFRAMIRPDGAALAPLVLQLLRRLHEAGDDTLNARLPRRVSDQPTAQGNPYGGRTALGLASEYGNLEVLELLLEYGARPDLPDLHGRLPNDPAYMATDEVRNFWAARG